MVAQIDSIIDTVRRYIAELEKYHIPVSQAILYVFICQWASQGGK